MKKRVRIFLATTVILMTIGITGQTHAQPRFIANIPANSANFTTIGNLVYFYSYNGNVQELWRTDGTTAGTFPLNIPTYISLCGDIECSMNYNNKIYSFDHNPADYNYSLTLWETDGTVEGTGKRWFEDFHGSIHSSIIANGRVFFVAYNPGDYVHDLWAVTLEGDAVKVVIWDYYSMGTWSGRMTKVNDLIFFAGDWGPSAQGAEEVETEDSMQLLQTSGGYPQAVKDIHGISLHCTRDIINYNGKVIFTRQCGSSNPKELWIYDPAIPPANKNCTASGTISVETWTGIDGRQVSSIPVNRLPNVTGKRNIFEAPTNVGNNFGSRFRGYVCVPKSGNYTFWIASDDQSELWLSTNADPVNKRRIAYHTGWTYPRQWTKYATQQSAPINLVAGQQYYIEALYKEDEGGDNMAVGWQLPDGTMERPIPGNRLSPFSNTASATAARTASEEELYSDIGLYPNPVQSGDSKLTISGYERIEKRVETHVEIINMAGNVVFAETIQCGGDCNSYLIKLNSKLVPGVYLVKFTTNDGRYLKRLLVK